MHSQDIHGQERQGAEDNPNVMRACKLNAKLLSE